MINIDKNFNKNCSATIFLKTQTLNDEFYEVVVQLKNILELIEFEQMDIESNFKESNVYPFNFIESLYLHFDKMVINLDEFKTFCSLENNKSVIIDNIDDFKLAYNKGLYIVPKYSILEQRNPRLRTTFNIDADGFERFDESEYEDFSGFEFYASKSKETIFNLTSSSIE